MKFCFQIWYICYTLEFRSFADFTLTCSPGGAGGSSKGSSSKSSKTEKPSMKNYIKVISKTLILSSFRIYLETTMNTTFYRLINAMHKISMQYILKKIFCEFYSVD